MWAWIYFGDFLEKNIGEIYLVTLYCMGFSGGSQISEIGAPVWQKGMTLNSTF
jgi:membrane associated rhomboid family serine protease